MSQNFIQDGVTLSVTVDPTVTKIYQGTPIYLTGGYAKPATITSGVDGIATATCAGTADANNYITNVCTFRTQGVFAFAPAAGTTLAVGDDIFVAVVDNTTASPVAYEQVGARTTVHNRATATTGDVAIGRCVGLGGGWGYSNLPATYGQVFLVTKQNSNIANK